MNIIYKLLHNEKYIKDSAKISNTKFITNGKWDWEHGIGHYKRTANYVTKILNQLNVDDRTKVLGVVAALLHDIGLVKGNKTNHAKTSSIIFTDYIDENDFTNEEIEIIREAIRNHSDGFKINSKVGLALFLADKLDVTYHRTINSSIQDETNKEFQKIKKVQIDITDNNLILNYITDNDFNISYLKDWIKCISTPIKVSKHLNKTFIFKVNNKIIDYNILFMSEEELINKLFLKYFENKDGITILELLNSMTDITNVWKNIKDILENNIDEYYSNKNIESIKEININNNNYLIFKIRFWKYLIIDINEQKVLNEVEISKIFDEQFFVQNFDEIKVDCYDKFILAYSILNYKGNINKLINFYFDNKEIFDLPNKLTYNIQYENALTYLNIDLANSNIELGFQEKKQKLFEQVFFNIDLSPIEFQDIQNNVAKKQMNQIFKEIKNIVIPLNDIEPELYDHYINKKKSKKLIKKK